MQVLRTCVFKKPNIVKAICQFWRVFIFWHILSYLFYLYLFFYLLWKCYGLDSRKCSIPITFLYVTYLGGKWDKNKVDLKWTPYWPYSCSVEYFYHSFNSPDWCSRICHLNGADTDRCARSVVLLAVSLSTFRHVLLFTAGDRPLVVITEDSELFPDLSSSFTFLSDVTASTQHGRKHKNDRGVDAN